jgi:hypothetical protein
MPRYKKNLRWEGETSFRQQHAPIPLGLSRPRSLTPPLREASTLRRLGTSLINRHRQISYDQQQCGLFKLPYEVREMIWKLVIGDNKIGLVHLSKRLGHFRCTWDDVEIHSCCIGTEWQAKSRYFESDTGAFEFAPRPFKRFGSLANTDYDNTASGLLYLAKTCRRMYRSSMK